MRILIDVLHPAHVHVFRNLIEEYTARGDVVAVTARDKDVTVDLLTAFSIEHTVLSIQGRGSVSLAIEWAQRTAKLGSVARRFRPDVLIGIMGVSIAPVGKLMRIPTIVFYDTEVARRTNAIVYPLATAVVTPDSYTGNRRENQVVYPGYHELAYLHPERFTPDAGVLQQFGIDASRPYTLVRFVGQDSSHDGDEVALGLERKTAIVERLSAVGQVVVSSERPLPDTIAGYGLSGPIHRIHDVVATARVVIGESATMASEAAMLGTPSVFIGATSRGYVDDLAARYGLIDKFSPSSVDAAVDRAVALARGADAATIAERHAAMLADKVDVTSWMMDFIDRCVERSP